MVEWIKGFSKSCLMIFSSTCVPRDVRLQFRQLAWAAYSGARTATFFKYIDVYISRLLY